jgi:hypothetical protein
MNGRERFVGCGGNAFFLLLRLACVKSGECVAVSQRGQAAGSQTEFSLSREDISREAVLSQKIAEQIEIAVFPRR